MESPPNNQPQTPQTPPPPAPTPNQPTPPLTQTPPQKKSGVNLLAIFFALLAIGATGAAAYFGYQNYILKNQVVNSDIQNQNLILSSTPSPSTDTESELDKGTVTQQNNLKHLAYVNYAGADNLYVFNIETDEVRQITNNNDLNSTYSWVIWKNNNTLAYWYCAQEPNKIKGNCSIVENNIDTKEETVILSEEVSYTPSEDSSTYYLQEQMRKFNFSHNQNLLTYAFEDNLYLYDLVSQKKNLLSSLPEVIGRGGSFNDTSRIKFSTQDSHFFYLDTARENGYLLQIFDSQGNIIKTPSSEVTFPLWINDQEIVYKQISFSNQDSDTNSLNTYNLTTDETLILQENTYWYDLEITPNKSLIGYNVRQDDDLPQFWVYDITSNTSKLIREDSYFLGWMSNSEAIVQNVICKEPSEAGPECDSIYGQQLTTYQKVSLDGEVNIINIPKDIVSIIMP